jgi:hypothetical protein
MGLPPILSDNQNHAGQNTGHKPPRTKGNTMEPTVTTPGADIGLAETQDAAERAHLAAMPIATLRRVAVANGIDPEGMKKPGIVDALMAGDELPAYPDGVPAFDPSPAPAAETIDAETLANEAAANAELDDAQRAVDGIEAGTDQLTFDGLGDRPTKSVVNVPALRIELPNRQFAKGERLKIIGYIDVDKVAFFNEKVGKQGTRAVRAHGAKWQKPNERVTIVAADE